MICICLPLQQKHWKEATKWRKNIKSKKAEKEKGNVDKQYTAINHIYKYIIQLTYPHTHTKASSRFTIKVYIVHLI